MLGIKPEEVINGYIGSHSHQIVTAFLAVGFALPLVRKSSGKPHVVSLLETFGLLLVAGATVLQVALYQYCAWFGWEPPDLFAKGSNGMPLDDFILVILGLGMLLLIPALLIKGREAVDSKIHSQLKPRLVTVLISAYMIAIVILGVYVEFHEQFFGHGEGPAPGTANDMAYIRSHLLFGFMIIPVLLVVLLNIPSSNTKRQQWLLGGFFIVVALTGAVGAFLWTFALDSFLVKVSMVFSVVLLIVFSAQFMNLKKRSP